MRKCANVYVCDSESGGHRINRDRERPPPSFLGFWGFYLWRFNRFTVDAVMGTLKIWHWIGWWQLDPCETNLPLDETKRRHFLLSRNRAAHQKTSFQIITISCPTLLFDRAVKTPMIQEAVTCLHPRDEYFENYKIRIWPRNILRTSVQGADWKYRGAIPLGSSDDQMAWPGPHREGMWHLSSGLQLHCLIWRLGAFLGVGEYIRYGLVGSSGRSVLLITVIVKAVGDGKGCSVLWGR